MKELKRYHVGELPLIRFIIEKMRLKNIFQEFLPNQGKEDIPVTEILTLLVYNLSVSKSPLYNLEKWISHLDLHTLGIEKYRDARFNDDRFGRALDKLFKTDRATLMTKIVLEVVRNFEIDLGQIHNDSTTVKAFGKYPGETETGFKLNKGVSKDRRPDLKQLLFTLSIARDGAIPIHFKTYPGNCNDDTTHIETWNTICELSDRKDFIYVADCKVCTDNQLNHIVKNGGRVITVIPDNWKDVKEFKESLRKKKKSKTEIWRRKIRKRSHGSGTEYDYYYTFNEKSFTYLRGYRIHWIYTTEKRVQDFGKREKRLKKAEAELSSLHVKINKRNLKTEEAIRERCKGILAHHRVGDFIDISVGQTMETHIRYRKKKDRHGNPLVHTKEEKTIYTLSWSRNKEKLKKEENVDGVYPILSTDENISARVALLAYKYQPRLEKRFSQFKSIHKAAPLLFKRLQRIEANMFLFFVALMVQALLEREVRKKMEVKNVEGLDLYPENRSASHPTTCKIFDIFSRVSTYEIISSDQRIESYKDELDDIQRQVLEILEIGEKDYWSGTPLGKTSISKCSDSRVID